MPTPTDEGMRLRVRVPADSPLSGVLSVFPARDRAVALLALAEVAAGRGGGQDIADLADAVRGLSFTLAGLGRAAGPVPPQTPWPLDAGEDQWA